MAGMEVQPSSSEMVEDQIEIEDDEDLEEEETPFVDQEALIRKLREKPELPSDNKECGTQCPKKSYKDWSAPLGDRLSLPSISAIDILKEMIPFPPGCVPPLALPSWHFLPLERRIPFLRAARGIIYYTRGKLGETLLRPRADYSTRDPLNYERVLGGPYNALHDPHIKELFYTPRFHDWLLRWGFISEKNEVLCTLKEFNKFRDYLRTVWCDLVSKEVESTDMFIKSQHEQHVALMKYESETAIEGKAAIVAARIRNAKKMHEELLEFKAMQQRQRDEISEARLKQWRENKERQLIEHILRGLEDARRTQERLRALYEARLQFRRNIMTKTVRKFWEAEDRRLTDKVLMEAHHQRFMMEWLESKYFFCYDQLITKKELQKDLIESRKYHARKRQQRLEAYREAMPSIQEKRKKETERIWGIVRKFAMRWLEKVRRRLNAPKDETHESSWVGQSKGVLEDTVKYLYQESGYERLDDFMMNILKLKKQIQAQIELEEAEEAAALAAEEEAEAETKAPEAPTEPEAAPPPPAEGQA